MEALHCEADGGGGGSGGDCVVFLHMGVDGGATEFKLECRAMNEVTKAGRQRQAFCLFLCHGWACLCLSAADRRSNPSTRTRAPQPNHPLGGLPVPRRAAAPAAAGAHPRAPRRGPGARLLLPPRPRLPGSSISQSVSQPVDQLAMIIVKKGAAGRTQPFTVLTFIHFTQPDTALFHIPPTEPNQPRRGSCGPRAGP